MTNKSKMIHETDLALKVINWLEAQHWEIYQEVKVNNSIADIVAIQGHLVWIIECKLSLSLNLIAQALEWRRDAHFVSVAIPKRKSRYPTKARRIALHILKHWGIGILRVRANKDIGRRFVSPPSINRKASTGRIKDSLNEHQKHWAPAGSVNGCWTPFKETSGRIVRAVNKNPGIILKDLIDKVDHHYASDASAKACIKKWVVEGIIKGIRCKRDGKFLKFYPEDKIVNEV